MNDEELRRHLDDWSVATCNRYHHILIDLGLLDAKRLDKMGEQIRQERNKMLDEFLPCCVKAVQEMIQDSNPASQTMPRKPGKPEG